jgi:ankyrin repeat protein|tara:strand:- start:228 stop:632 length:405 start_codon:yes stop_codon:yes gene_type:complete
VHAQQRRRYIAALAGHFELVHSCYLAGADVNRPSASGATPLIACCGRGHAECAAVLRHAGANMATEHRGHTAMEWALHHGHMEVLRVLAMRDPTSIFDSGEASPGDRTRLSIFRNSMPMERELPMDDEGPNVAL